MQLPADGLVTLALAVDHGSVTRAARALGITQPAATNRLRALEAVVGRRLYEASRGGLALTPAGEELIAHARAVAGALERAGAAALAVAGEERRVVVAVSETAVPVVAPALADAALHPARPDVRVTARDAAAAVRAVRSGSADLAVHVAFPREDLRGLEHRQLGEDAIVLLRPAGSPAAPDPAPLDLLAGTRLLLQATGSGVRATAERVLAAAGVEPAARIETGSSLGVAAAVAAGRGVGLLPRAFAAPWIAAGLVVADRLAAPDLVARYAVLSGPAEGLAPAVRAVHALLRARTPA